MNQISLGDDRVASYYAKFIIITYTLIGFFEKIHSIVDVILVLDGIVTVFALLFITFWFYSRKRFPCNFGSVSFVTMTFFILFSSLVGGSDLERFSVSGFAIVETWALILAFIEIKKDIHDVFLYFSIFAVVFSFIYSIFGLVQGIESEEIRFSGLSDQSNSLGVMAALSIILCMMNIRKWKRVDATVVWNIFTIGLIPFFLYILWKSDSRTSLFALVVSCLFIVIVALLFLYRRTKAFWAFVPALCVVIAALIFILSGDRSVNSYTLDKLSSGRTIIWRETLESMDVEEYIFGFSGNSKKMVEKLEANEASSVTLVNQGERHLAHNMYLGVFFEYGIIAALSFIVGWLWIMGRGLGYMKGEKKWALREVFASLSILSFFIIHSLAESSIYFIGGAEQLLFIMSISAIYSITVAKRRKYNE